MRWEVESAFTGFCAASGLKVGPTTSQSFAARISHLVAGQASLAALAGALLSVHAVASPKSD